MAITVFFNSVDEYIEELRKSPPRTRSSGSLMKAATSKAHHRWY